MGISSNIHLTKLDKKRGIRIPAKIDTGLAYLCGILAGDGHITYNKNSRSYMIKCVGNPTDERHFYNDVIKPLIKGLFGLDVKTRLYDNDTTYGFQVHSKTIVEFLCFGIGMPHGNKSGTVRIIDCFLKSNDLLISFIRGFADTDFCLTLKKRYKDIHYYPVIVGVSKSKDIIQQICDFLESNEFKVSKDFDRKFYDKRVMKYTVTHRFQLYGHHQLTKWMELIGFNNPKHIKKYNRWKKLKLIHSWPRIRNL